MVVNGGGDAASILPSICHDSCTRVLLPASLLMCASQRSVACSLPRRHLRLAMAVAVAVLRPPAVQPWLPREGRLRAQPGTMLSAIRRRRLRQLEWRALPRLPRPVGLGRMGRGLTGQVRQSGRATGPKPTMRAGQWRARVRVPRSGWRIPVRMRVRVRVRMRVQTRVRVRERTLQPLPRLTPTRAPAPPPAPA